MQQSIIRNEGGLNVSVFENIISGAVATSTANIDTQLFIGVVYSGILSIDASK